MSFDINELNPHDNVHSECDLEIYQLKQENARLREILTRYRERDLKMQEKLSFCHLCGVKFRSQLEEGSK